MAAIQQCPESPDRTGCDDEEAPDVIDAFCATFVGDLAVVPANGGVVYVPGEARAVAQCNYFGADPGAVPPGDAEFYANISFGLDLTLTWVDDYGMYVSPTANDADQLVAACESPSGVEASDDGTFACIVDGDRAAYLDIGSGRAEASFVAGDMVISFQWDPTDEIDRAVAQQRFLAIVQRAGVDTTGLDPFALLPAA